MESIHPHGYWCGKEVFDQHAFDPYLARALVDFFQQEKIKSIGDFGCGLGDYVKTLRASHFHAQGFDGNPDTKTLTEGVGEVLDLSQIVDLKVCFDWVLSLEVGEHIPPSYESTFIDNLHRHNKKGILLSWAVEGQKGFGHFNTQSNGYIKKRFQDLGYINDLIVEKKLRESSTLSWFKNSIMVFRQPVKD